MSALPPKADIPLTILSWFFSPTNAICGPACHHVGHCGYRSNEMPCDCARESAAKRESVSLVLSIPMIRRRNCSLRATVLRRALCVCEPFW